MLRKIIAKPTLNNEAEREGRKEQTNIDTGGHCGLRWRASKNKFEYKVGPSFGKMV